ncbi:MAG: hypothetical protein AAB332_04615, partial [Planctomycetota bacterium]
MNKGIIGVIFVVAFALFGCTIAFCDVSGEAKKETASAQPVAEKKPNSEGGTAPVQVTSTPPVEAQKPAPAGDTASTQAKVAPADGSVTVSSQPQVEEKKPAVEGKKPTAEKKKPAVKKEETASHPKDKRTIQQIISELTKEK